MERYLNINEVMAQTGLKYSFVYRAAKSGIFPATIIPSGKKSKILFPDKELDAKLKNLRKS